MSKRKENSTVEGNIQQAQSLAKEFEHLVADPKSALDALHLAASLLQSKLKVEMTIRIYLPPWTEVEKIGIPIVEGVKGYILEENFPTFPINFSGDQTVN